MPHAVIAVVVVEPERLFKYRFAIESLNTLITFRLTPEGEGWPNLLAKIDATL